MSTFTAAMLVASPILAAIAVWSVKEYYAIKAEVERLRAIRVMVAKREHRP